MGNETLTQPARRSRRWPLFVLGLLIAQATGLAVMITIAVSDPSVAVEPDYYEKALGWDAAAASQGAAERLGWSATVSAGPLSSADRELHVNINARDGSPVNEARVHVETFHQARSGARLNTDMAGVGGGGYATRLPILRPGLWEVRLTVRRGPDCVAFVRTLEVGAGP